MIDRVRAVEFCEPMESGTKMPCLMVCENADGRCEVVVKFRETVHRDVFSLVGEWVASRFGRDLGFETAEIVAVELDESLADEVRAVGQMNYARQFERSPGWNIGSRLLGPGYCASVPTEGEMARQRAKFTEVVAFDFVIQNFDRRLDNPNYLRSGDHLVLIDHEQAFGHLDRDGAEPFSANTLNVENTYSHIFFPAFDLLPELDGFFARLATMPSGSIGAYFSGLPPEWLDIRSERLERYLHWASNHADALRDRLVTIIHP